jgi:hypothetical protein
MMNYNYREAMVSDILDYIREEITLSEYSSREDLAEYLEERLWICDRVTGNASGSYTFNSYTARECVLDNIDDLNDAFDEFCVDASEIGNHFILEDWEWMDVTIRCYLLGQCIESAIDLLEESDELETPWTEEA